MKGRREGRFFVMSWANAHDHRGLAHRQQDVYHVTLVNDQRD
jgi:hypothetical protein